VYVQAESGTLLQSADRCPDPAARTDRALDPAKARNLAETIDREVTDQAPWVPLFTPQSIDLTSARVGNYQAERGRTLLDQLWVK
jgi:peptide/nickel transport system substrate-binding protein